MSRKIAVNGQKFEVSKSESKAFSILKAMPKEFRQPRFDTWFATAETEEAIARRKAIGLALGLQVPND